MCLPHEALQTQKRLCCSPQDVAVVANDYDYCFQGGAFHLAILCKSGPTTAGTCWTVIPDDLLLHLNICHENATWLPVLVNNDYSQTGLPGVSMMKACTALAQQPPLALNDVLNLPAISRVWSNFTPDQRTSIQGELENATLALGAFVTVSQSVDSSLHLELQMLPCLTSDLRQIAQEEHAYHNAVSASQLSAGKVVIIWGVPVLISSEDIR